MKKGILLIGLLAIAILLSGCVQPPVCGNGIIESGESCDLSYCGAAWECKNCECIIIEQPECGFSESCATASDCPDFVGPLPVGEEYIPICEDGCCKFNHISPNPPNPPLNPPLPIK